MADPRVGARGDRREELETLEHEGQRQAAAALLREPQPDRRLQRAVEGRGIERPRAEPSRGRGQLEAREDLGAPGLVMPNLEPGEGPVVMTIVEAELGVAGVDLLGVEARLAAAGAQARELDGLERARDRGRDPPLATQRPLALVVEAIDLEAVDARRVLLELELELDAARPRHDRAQPHDIAQLDRTELGPLLGPLPELGEGRPRQLEVGDAREHTLAFDAVASEEGLVARQVTTQQQPPLRGPARRTQPPARWRFGGGHGRGRALDLAQMGRNEVGGHGIDRPQLREQCLRQAHVVARVESRGELDEVAPVEPQLLKLDPCPDVPSRDREQLGDVLGHPCNHASPPLRRAPDDRWSRSGHRSRSRSRHRCGHRSRPIGRSDPGARAREPLCLGRLRRRHEGRTGPRERGVIGRQLRLQHLGELGDRPVLEHDRWRQRERQLGLQRRDDVEQVGRGQPQLVVPNVELDLVWLEPHSRGDEAAQDTHDPRWRTSLGSGLGRRGAQGRALPRLTAPFADIEGGRHTHPLAHELADLGDLDPRFVVKLDAQADELLVAMNRVRWHADVTALAEPTRRTERLEHQRKVEPGPVIAGIEHADRDAAPEQAGFEQRRVKQE
ncbi:hypothetical protein DB30_03357 [Enhygromyxa salina]|uniref:Uncharacterized protein n=1 Tax=Enhygromyxa salina TaxID=215803 RepID=A0A0C2A214_9BACT|nr:hypothetical protein DB30_03357 [Enhygromyxa salina]